MHSGLVGTLARTPQLGHTFAMIGGFVITGFELYCYGSIYRHMMINDWSVRAILPENVYRKRTRQNAINLTGHAVQFAVEFVYLMVQFFYAIAAPVLVTKHINFNLRYFSLGVYGMSGFLCIVSQTKYRQELATLCHFAALPAYMTLRALNLFGVTNFSTVAALKRALICGI